MKIMKVTFNHKQRAFDVRTRGRNYVFPYAVVRPAPTRENKVIEAHVDAEMDREGFVYVLESGEEGAVHIDHVLDYNSDPNYMADALLYKLNLQAQVAVKESGLSTRELIRRLSTSPSQFYRLLDQTNYRKSMHQLVALLHVLGCRVDIVLTPEKSHGGRTRSHAS